MTARGKLPGKVAALLSAPANVALHGSPGSGKSYITDRVIGHLAADESISVVRVDLSTTMSGAAVFEEVHGQIGSGVTAAPINSRSVHVAWRGLRDALSRSE